jgi:hypothetical protein
VNKLLQLAVVLPLVVLAACGPDEHLKVGDGGIGSDAGPPTANLTAYVIDLINNHGSDQAPRPYSEFGSLPDPDGDSNTTTAYGSLFP